MVQARSLHEPDRKASPKERMPVGKTKNDIAVQIQDERAPKSSRPCWLVSQPRLIFVKDWGSLPALSGHYGALRPGLSSG